MAIKQQQHIQQQQPAKEDITTAIKQQNIQQQQLIQENIAMAIQQQNTQQQNTHQQNTQQQSTQQRSTHQRIQGDITSHFVNASTPLLGMSTFPAIENSEHKKNSPRGDPATLCGPKGPGVCYVDCKADCRDIKPTASASRLTVYFIEIFFLLQKCTDIAWNKFRSIVLHLFVVH